MGVCSEGVKEYLLNFDIALKDKSHWPYFPKSAKVHCGDTAGFELASHLVDRNLCTLLDYDEVFGWPHKNLLSGMFGVPKLNKRSKA